MRKNQLLSVFSLFLLVPASITRAQTATLTGTVSIEQDYRVVKFHSPQGNYNVTLPGVLNGPGQGAVMLSGTVMTEAAGKTEKEKTSNLKALQKMLLTIGGKSISILPGQNHFDFSMPANLTTPVSIDLADPMGNRATVNLKNPVVSSPPTTGALPVGQQSLFTDQKVFLTNGNIPVYAANNTSTLFQPTDKFFIKDANGGMTEATKIAQCPTQTVLSTQGIQPGATTIVRQSGNRTDQVNVRMANLTLSASENNLRNGQTSTVTAKIDPKITDKDSADAMQIPIMNLDMRNLTPGVIDMTGGNVQVMTFPTTPGSTSPAAWQATRTITGVTPGNFNISASLYPSSTISNNMANTQMQALKTVDEFNKWIDAVKQQLENLFSSSNDQTTKDLIRNTINALPLCRTVDELDVCKVMANNLLRTSAIPGLNLATTAPAFAAYQAATSNLINASSTNPGFVHTDVIQNGLTYLQNASSAVNDPTTNQYINAAQLATKAVQNDYSAKNINTLAVALQKLNNSTFVAGLINNNGAVNITKQTKDTLPQTLYNMKFDPFAPLTPDPPKPVGLTVDDKGKTKAPFTYKNEQCGEKINLRYYTKPGDETGFLQIKNTGKCPLSINIFAVGGGSTISVLGTPQSIPAANGKQATGLSYLVFTIDLKDVKEIKIAIECHGETTSSCNFTGQFSVGGKDNANSGGRRTSLGVTMLPIDMTSPAAITEKKCLTKTVVLAQFRNTSKSYLFWHPTAVAAEGSTCPFYVFGSEDQNKSYDDAKVLEREKTATDFDSGASVNLYSKGERDGGKEKNSDRATIVLPPGKTVYLLGQCLGGSVGTCEGGVK